MPWKTVFLKDRMRMFKDHNWWLGLTDEDIEGAWKWFDTDEMANFTDFMPGDGGDHNTEDCAAFCLGSYDYHWCDAPCSYLTAVLCETREHEEVSVIG
ncbi:hepatic lectin-like [Dreissena polymorpha]|uniref:hepatic lectin-like n=1 Tax=Dreissena polymorpha TaxID=45954 RepID=UPI0022652270|nr:hepatic lectin-like [Dreissena polymorpha]